MGDLGGGGRISMGEVCGVDLLEGLRSLFRSSRLEEVGPAERVGEVLEHWTVHWWLD
jgi:hypothetical protein